MSTVFDPKQLNFPILLDGGLSNQLEEQGIDLNHKLWTARLLDENPNAIIEAHLSYLKAGARILITSSYQSSVEGFVNAGYSETRALELILLTSELANEGIKRFRSEFGDSENVWIAASVGPYGAFLADGSEYNGNYSISQVDLIAFHLSKLKSLENSSADFFACETIPSLLETEVLNELLRIMKKPAWVSFACCDGQHINDGTPIRRAAQMLNANNNIFAVGVNCTAPQFVTDLISELKAACPNKRIVVYPNSGETYDATEKKWSGKMNPLICGMQSLEWIRAGADIIGGCCRMGPEHIAAIGTMLKSL